MRGENNPRHPGDHDHGGRVGARHRPSARIVVAALAFAGITYGFQQAAIIPVIPAIQHDFHASSTWAAWLLTGYLIVGTVLTPVFGRLADLHGAGRMLVASLALFFAGSVAAALVPNLPGLIISRALQGAGGAVLPLSFAVARHHVDDRLLGRAIGLLTAAFSLGITLGFATGGVMTKAVSWRLVFGTGAVAIAAGIAMLVRVLPLASGSGKGRFDVGGAVWLGAASMALLLALTLGTQLGWLSPAPIPLFVGCTVTAALWVRTELRHEQPLIDLRVLRNRTVTLVNAATVCLGWGRFTSLLLIPMLVTGAAGSGYGFGAGAAMAGWFLLPDGAGSTLGGLVSGRLAARIGPGRVFASGLLVTALAGVLVAAALHQIVAVLVGALLFGLGSALALQASSAVTTGRVPKETAAASVSLNSTLRRLFGGVGAQVSMVLVAMGAGRGRATAVGFIIAFAAAAALALVGSGLALAADRQLA